MLGYMDRDAAKRYTIDEGLVTFFSRSKQRLWTRKNPSSGNHLAFVRACLDCDRTGILVEALPTRPVAGTRTCFTDDLPTTAGFSRISTG